MPLYRQILDFWFGRPGSPSFGEFRSVWLSPDADLCLEIKSRFQNVVESALLGELDQWKEDPHSCLALLIVLDKFVPICFQQSVASCEQALLSTAEYALERGFDAHLLPVQRRFIYYPLERLGGPQSRKKVLSLYESPDNDFVTIDPIAV